MQEDLKLGCILPPTESTASPLPLQNTSVNAKITGAIANVTVKQRFNNHLTEAISLRYLFPLPAEAAIVDYVISIGSRTIKAQMQEKEAARQTFETAAQQGQRASLLEQQRPNLFSIELANVQPGETILTEVIYEERIAYEDSGYQFVFPMGITPRYHSPNIVQHRSTADVEAPVTADNAQVGPVEIRVSIDAGVPLPDPVSRTHPIVITRQDERHVSLTLGEGRHIPNKDFVLKFAVSGERMQSAAWSSKSDEGDTSLLMLIPPRLDLNESAAPREFIFVVDRSGSMSGGPMEQSVNALKACLRALSDADTFLIQAFDDRIEWFDIKPRPVTQANIDAADKWLSSVDARGGTEILPAIAAALTLPADKERQRYVVFLTDGAVSADDQAIAQIAKQRGEARVFSFGIGPSVNRYLLSKMAQMGRGVAEFLGVDDDIEGALTRFQDRVSYPALLDLAITWHNATAWDTYPASLPDLYIGQPLEISTRLKRTGNDAAAIATGKARGQQVTFQAPLPAATEPNPTIERLHARARIESLMDDAAKGGDVEKIRRQVISLAIEHRLMTPYTSFVAVDSEKTTSTGGKEVDVAVPLPDGLKMEGFFGEDQSQVISTAKAIPRAGKMRAMYLSAPSASPSAPPPPAKPTSPASSSLPGAALDEPEFERMSPKDDARLAMASRDLSSEINAALNAPEANEEEKGGNILSNLAGKVFGRDKAKKQAESRTTDHFLDQVMKAAEPAPGAGGPLGDIQPPDIELGLRNLARTQNVNGSWQDDVEITAAALLAFVRAGHTTRKGQYRRQVQKAMTWLMAQLPSTRGFAAFAALRALDDLYGETGDGQVPDSVRHSLPQPQTYLERAASGEALPPLDPIENLDALRIAAFVKGHAHPPFSLLQGEERDRAMVWTLVGAPRAQ